MTRRVARLAPIALTFGASLLFAVPASAGGAVWEFDKPFYAPGETALARTAVAWEHDANLGTPEDGPYYAYVSPFDLTPDAASTTPWPHPPPDAVRVAQLQISMEPYETAGGVLVGPHHASIEFVVPTLRPGQYMVDVCNDPCTTTFADITYGVLNVMGPPAATWSCPETMPTSTTSSTVPTTTTTTTTAREPTNEESRSGDGVTAAVATSTALAGAAGGTALARRRRSV